MTMFTDRFAHGTFGHASKSPRRRWSWAAAGAVADNILTTLLGWQERARQRRQLLSLGTEALKDFGRSRTDAAAEGDKPFWRD